MRLKLQFFGKSEDGSIAVETALLMAVIGFMGLGVLDFGLAYTRNLELANAARAGMQYAMVRKPIDEDYSDIIDAVTAAAPTLKGGENREISTNLYCECPDGTPSECVSDTGDDLVCDDGNLRSSYLEITIAETYSLLFSYPGINSDLTLSESTTLRMN
jgi:hypothetical protein